MIPTQQRFKAADAIFFQVIDRLIIQAELIVRQRLAQIEFEPAAALQSRIHFRFEETPCSAPIRLGTVKCDVGILEKFVTGHAIIRRHRDSDAHTKRNALSIDFVWFAENADNAHGKRGNLVRPLDVLQEDGEFIAAKTGHRIDLANARLQTQRHRTKDLVSDRMAERVVDLLEVVEVEAENCKADTTAELGDALLNSLRQKHAIRQFGEGVVPRHEDDAFFRLAPFSHVFVGRYPAAIDGRAMRDRNNSSVVELLEISVRRVSCRFLEQVGDGFPRMVSDRHAQFHDVTERHARLNFVGRQIENFGEAPVHDA